MKKLLMALALLPLMASAEVRFTYEKNGDGTISLTGINGSVPADLLVASKYDGHKVTSVGSGFAKDASTLRSVTISEGILSVGSKAFSGCENLQSVSFPASLTTVYDRAFTVDGQVALEGKCQLQHISVSPGNRCFQMNGPVLVDLNARSAILAQRDASEVSLPDYVETIERRCFSGCGKLTKVIGGSGLRRISEEAFLFCRKLATVQLMDTCLESIRKKAFSGCDSLVNIEIPESLSELSAHTFRWCNRLTECIIHGDAPAVVLEQEEDGWGVAMDYVYVTSNANLDPSRFPWNDYYSGARVLDSVVTYVDPEAHGWGNVPGTWQGRPIRYIGMSPQVGSLEVIPGEAVALDIGLIDYTAKGLPSGLKYNKKTGKITGAAKKPTAAEGVTVKFTKKGEADEEMIIVVEKERMSVGCAGLEGRVFTVGVAGAAGIPIEIETQSGVKSVAVSKLPSGMKYDKKTGMIVGAPTKAGSFDVTIKVTAKSGAVETLVVPVTVAALPDWAVGTFVGMVRQVDYDAQGNVVVNGDGRHDWYDGEMSVTVSAKGKISGKLKLSGNGGTGSFSASGFSECGEDGCVATGSLKLGKEKGVVELRVAPRALTAGGSDLAGDVEVSCRGTESGTGYLLTFSTDERRPLRQQIWKSKTLPLPPSIDKKSVALEQDGLLYTLSFGKNGVVNDMLAFADNPKRAIKKGKPVFSVVGYWDAVWHCELFGTPIIDTADGGEERIRVNVNIASGGALSCVLAE